jgi:hypothetical protein
MIKDLRWEAKRQGVHPSCLAYWIHRKYGDFIVKKIRKDGLPGTSLPCVMCRKALERSAIQWRAHIGHDWYRSTDPATPESHPTNRQRTLNFKLSIK